MLRRARGVVVAFVAACASDAPPNAPPSAPPPSAPPPSAPPPSAPPPTEGSALAPATLQHFTKAQLEEALPELTALLSTVPGTRLVSLGPVAVEGKHDAYVAMGSWCVGDGRLSADELVALQDLYGKHPLYAQADRRWRENFAAAARKVEAALRAAGWQATSRQANTVSIGITGRLGGYHLDLEVAGIRTVACTSEDEPYSAGAHVLRVGAP